MGKWLVIGLLLLSTMGEAMAENHVRIVLDVSGSMRTNDSSRNAILATLLLHDLVSPNTDGGDSFAVLPFNKKWRWEDPGIPPVQSGSSIKATSGKRARFVKSIKALKYNAQCTYFYPGLKKALDELKTEKPSDYANQVIVLVTDGVPSNQCNSSGTHTLQEEKRLIIDELVPRFNKVGIALYVLAFGNKVVGNRIFFDEITKQLAINAPIKIDPDGKGLVSNMRTIFEQAFGFETKKPVTLGSKKPRTLNLNKGMDPYRTAVVAHVPLGHLSNINLKAPPTMKLNAKDPLCARESGGSYCVQWVQSPDKGRYRLSGVFKKSAKGRVTVLRPVELDLRIVPWNPKRKFPSLPAFTIDDRAMATRKFVLGASITTKHGGVAPDVNLEYRYSSLNPEGKIIWRKWRAPPPNRVDRNSAARIYPLPTTFPVNAREKGKTYDSRVEIVIRRGSAELLRRTDSQAHVMQVWPFLSLKPRPNPASTGNPLKANQEGCASFTFSLQSDFPQEKSFPITGDLKIPNNASGLLDKTRFSLDGIDLTTAPQPSDPAAATTESWSKGLDRTLAELAKPHRMCVTLGRPRQGAANKPIMVTTGFTLNQAPYDEYDVVRPLRFKIRMAKIGVRDRYGAMGLVGLLALLSLLLLYYARFRPVMSEDFRYRLWTDSEGSHLPPEANRLPPVSSLRRVLGISYRYDIKSVDGQPVARLRPTRDKQLFVLDMDAGTMIKPMEGNDTLQPKGHSWAIEAGRDYRIDTGERRWIFRTEYAS
uniref:von Willebrand factor type A domain-containing protein n=1 Tax=Candidatus Kentrum sp. LPFa TaxID=2126335 RepID=A0A450W674_9GAMM|nr:MAG: von Willebrand factor type A domain-containing protein [Candidatus Kentron sp. LPFa]